MRFINVITIKQIKAAPRFLGGGFVISAPLLVELGRGRRFFVGSDGDALTACQLAGIN